MRASCIVVVDCPDWSLGQKFRRVLPFCTRLDAAVHPLYPSRAALQAGGAPDLAGLPSGADAYLFASWAFAWQFLESARLPVGAALLVDVVDEYSWARAAWQFEAVCEHADVVLTQSLAHHRTDACAVFHPYPVAPEHLGRARPLRRPGDRLRVGMIASGWEHDGGDHKGVGIARAVAEALPWVELRIAGTDYHVPQDQLADWYDALDVFVTLSASEGFSAATTDALALGVPVLGTPIVPLRPFLDMHRYTAVNRNADHVADRLAHMRDTYADRRLDALAARTVAARWSAERVAAIYEREILGAVARYGDERARRHPIGL